MPALLVFDDVDAAAICNAPRMQQIQLVIRTDVDLNASFACAGRQCLAQIQGETAVGNVGVQGGDLLRPAVVVGAGAVRGIDEGLGRKGDDLVVLSLVDYYDIV
ncbi:MAG: hypothetical protein K0S99_3196 [Thermomicrobiales bacterium]|nr:hypothetical protein [Thermomicrobiales bacterium]